MKKRTLALILSIILAVLSVSCGSGSAEKLDAAGAVTKAMADYKLTGGEIYSSADIDGAYPLSEDLLVSYYGRGYDDYPDISKVSEYTVWINTDDPMHPMEMGVFRLQDPSYTDELKEYIGVRLYSVTENAKGYPSLDVRCYSDALVGAKDDYVWYIAVPDSASKIDKLFSNSL